MEIQLGVTFIGFAAAYTLVTSRRQRAAAQQGATERPAEQQKSSDAADDPAAYHHRPTLGGVLGTMWTALVGEDDED